jgi:hypothetical protein
VCVCVCHCVCVCVCVCCVCVRARDVLFASQLRCIAPRGADSRGDIDTLALTRSCLLKLAQWLVSAAQQIKRPQPGASGAASSKGVDAAQTWSAEWNKFCNLPVLLVQ